MPQPTPGSTRCGSPSPPPARPSAAASATPDAFPPPLLDQLAADLAAQITWHRNLVPARPGRRYQRKTKRPGGRYKTRKPGEITRLTPLTKIIFWRMPVRLNLMPLGPGPHDSAAHNTRPIPGTRHAAGVPGTTLIMPSASADPSHPNRVNPDLRSATRHNPALGITLVSPAVVLGGEPPDQRGDVGTGRRSSRAVRKGPFPGDQVVTRRRCHRRTVPGVTRRCTGSFPPFV
jgi:hypothetical protein